MGNFDTKDVVSATTLLVLVYLILNNGDKTTSVITSLSKLYDGAVSTLQGNGAGAASA
jgi:hypothetical protein